MHDSKINLLNELDPSFKYFLYDIEVYEMALPTFFF